MQGIANVKVSSVEGLLQNSVERFLDVPQSEIAEIAKETLEGNLRGVLATLTPEEVNEDRLKFAQTLIDEADDDIKPLGLELDVCPGQCFSWSPVACPSARMPKFWGHGWPAEPTTAMMDPCQHRSI